MRRKRLVDLPGEFDASPTGVKSRSFMFQLITPMFGGGVESWKLDTKNPVRSQAVKGQLRFWWRTMQNYDTPVDLLIAENELWGGLTRRTNARGDEADVRVKSTVLISVTEQAVPREGLRVAEMESNYAVKGDTIPKYVLFPITKPVKDDAFKIHFVSDLTFKLTVQYPVAQEETVLNTLRLWMLFGGVGARTRRGSGSLYCEELMKGLDSAAAVRALLSKLNPGGAIREYPTLAGCTLYAREERGEPAVVWHALLERYGAYRQDRAPGKPRPGRSYWPEPDAIRDLTGTYSAHPPRHPDGQWFPRAAFGLPIITRFQNRDGQGDPEGQYELEPDTGAGQRWPSPVIMKVIRLSSGLTCSCALVLNQQPPAALKLTGAGGPFRISGSQLPGAYAGKEMKMNDKLDGRTIYKALADHLRLQEVT